VQGENQASIIILQDKNRVWKTHSRLASTGLSAVLLLLIAYLKSNKDPVKILFRGIAVRAGTARQKCWTNL